jgi:hypothetical protein
MGDEAAADSLNTPDRQPNRETLDSGLLVASIVASEYIALTANQRSYLTLVAAAQSLPLTANLKAELGAIFGAGTATRAFMSMANAIGATPIARQRLRGAAADAPEDDLLALRRETA